MDKFTQELQKDINKLVGELKDEDQLRDILKKKLTKKEFKFYNLKIENQSQEVIQDQLHCDKERFEAIKKQTILKINQEKIKKELVNI